MLQHYVTQSIRILITCTARGSLENQCCSNSHLIMTNTKKNTGTDVHFTPQRVRHPVREKRNRHGSSVFEVRRHSLQRSKRLRVIYSSVVVVVSMRMTWRRRRRRRRRTWSMRNVVLRRFNKKWNSRRVQNPRLMRLRNDSRVSQRLQSVDTDMYAVFEREAREF